MVHAKINLIIIINLFCRVPVTRFSICLDNGLIMMYYKTHYIVVSNLMFKLFNGLQCKFNSRYILELKLGSGVYVRIYKHNHDAVSGKSYPVLPHFKLSFYLPLTGWILLQIKFCKLSHG